MSNQTLYIMKEQKSNNNGKGVIVGILKTGEKKLFLADRRGVQREVSPLCVLDFYVHETKQRCGNGKTLFEAMLKAENLKPFEIAIDRPSPKFLGFLQKHYKLQSYIRQANNYVVFDQFFTTCTDDSQKSRRCVQHNVMSLSPSTKSPSSRSSLAQNPTSIPRLTDHTAKVEETKDVCASNNVPSSNEETGSPASKGVLIRSADHSNSPRGVQSDFTWSPQTHNRGFDKRRSGQVFDIISGHPLHQETNPTATKHGSNPFYTNLNNKVMDTDGVKSNGSIPTGPNAHSDNASSNAGTQQQAQKAPHLDMRQIGRSKPQKNASFGGLSTYRASFKPMTAFHSTNSSVVPNATNQWDTSTSIALTYSRHSIPETSKSAPQIGGFATSIGSGRSLMRSKGVSSTSRDMSENKLKGKWKPFIL